MKNLHQSLFIISVAALVGAAPAAAQAEGEGGYIETITVTATKRPENIQDVPLAITAFDADAIDRDRVDDLQEIAIRTPSFLIGQNGPTAPELTIRGIGSTDREAGADRSVVVFVDEVYIGRAGASTFDLYDLERIEVLRGPQGSLFGRNVVGGSVNLVTADPTFDYDTKLSLSRGALDLLEARGVVTGGFNDRIAGRLAISVKSRNGYIQNRRFDFRTQDNTQSYSGRGKLLFEPRADFRHVLTVEVSTDSVDGISSTVTQGETPDDAFLRQFSSRFDGVVDQPGSDRYDSDNNEFGEMDRDLWSVAWRGEWATDVGDVTLLTSYRSAGFDLVRDLAGIPVAEPGEAFVTPAGYKTLGFSRGYGFESTAINDEDYRALSAEVRLASKDDSDSPWVWLAGAYFLNESTDRDQIRERNLAQTSTNRSQISRPRFDQSNNLISYAVFGQATVSLLEDRLGITFGARYTSDDKDFDLVVTDTLTAEVKAAIIATIPEAINPDPDMPDTGLSPASSEFSASAGESFSQFTPEVTVDYRVKDNVLIYARGSTGFKSGGFAGLGANAQQAMLPFEEETALNLELGVKSSLADNRAIINASLFRVDFEDLQLRDRQLLIPGDETSAIVTTVNAASAEISGLEADVTLNPIANLNIVGGISFLSTEIDDVAEGSNIEQGTELPKAPGFSVNWGVDYRFPGIGPGDLTVGGSIQHIGEHFFDINEDTAGTESAYTLVNARVAWVADDGRWSAALWMKNLGDKYYRTQVQSALNDEVGILTRVGEPRTWGITIDFCP